MEFLKNIIQKIGQPTKMAGIEASIQNGDGVIFHLTILEKKKGEISIIRNEVELLNFEQLSSHLHPSIPIYLTLNGRGILNKQLEDVYQNTHQLLQAILPNATSEDFVVQKTEMHNGVIGSIVRKDVLEKTLADFQDAKLWVTNIALGNFDVKFLLPFLEIKNDVPTSSQIIHFNLEEEIISYSKNKSQEEQSIKLGDEYLNYKNLVSYALALKGLLALPSEVHLPQIESNQDEFLQQQIFKKVGIGVLATFLTLLILNTFFYYQLKDKNQTLSSQLFLQQGQLAELDSLKAKLTAQEKFFSATNLHQSSKASFYADQVAASVPKGIQFSLLEVFPELKLQNGFEEEQLQQFKKNEILIKGFCKSSMTYNRWLKALKKLDWVKEVNHLDYKDVDNQIAEFEMKIII